MHGLLRLRARTYALFYLLLIPLYAAIYSALPSHFHHTTAAYEPAIKEDGARLAIAFRDAIVLAIRETTGGDIVSTKAGQLDANSIAVFYVEAKEHRVLFTILIQQVAPGRAFRAFRASLRMNRYVESRKPNGDQQYGLLRVSANEDEITPSSPDKDASDIHLGDICRKRSGFPPGGGEEGVAGVITLSDETQRRVFAFMDASRGFPALSSGTLSRMFYFSAITITTVGFGDIVPVTNPARLLVASEAILGTIAIGLFLNAIGQRIARSAASKHHDGVSASAERDRLKKE